MWKKAEKDEKAPPAFLMGKNFESGTLAFRLIFGKEDSILSLYILWTSAKDHIEISISPHKLKIIHHDNGS